MEKGTRFIGLDVHKASIAVAVAGAFGDPEDHGQIANDPAAIRKLVDRLGGPDVRLSVAYEAGPTGYALHRQLTALGIECIVVAPSLIPARPGDRVKTDRRDAAKLARLLRSGDLTAVWNPDQAGEALRDLVRARDDAKADQLRARHRLAARPGTAPSPLSQPGRPDRQEQDRHRRRARAGRLRLGRRPTRDSGGGLIEHEAGHGRVGQQRREPSTVLCDPDSRP